MKDKITLKQVIFAVIGFIIVSLILIPIGETLIYDSRYVPTAETLSEVDNEDFYMKVNMFVSSNVDGLVDVDIIKKNDKWKYAEVQVIDEDGYIIYSKYVDLANCDVNSKFNLEFGYHGEDSAYLNIAGANKFRNRITIFKSIKEDIQNFKVYKWFVNLYNKHLKDKVDKAQEEIINLYNKYLKDKVKLEWSEIKAKAVQIPTWLKGIYVQGTTMFFGLHPGIRSILAIALIMLFT